MKTALIIAVLSLSGGSLPSNDLPKASKEYLKDAIEICKQYALDEEVKDDKYDKYILTVSMKILKQAVTVRLIKLI